MPPSIPEPNVAASVSEGKQYLYIIRHGDRWDYQNREWPKTTTRPGDPPVSGLGLQQARETGIFLNELFSSEGYTAEDITWMSSPFLRCLMTSNTAIDALSDVEGSSQMEILPESSVWEWDGYNGKLHESLPELEERVHYFPRLNVSYESLFVPQLPEPRSDFHQRCQKVVEAIGDRHSYRPKSALVVVSHAAGCISMTAAAAQVALSEVTPAAPCSIYRLSRTSDTNQWELDPHDAPQSMNGHTKHMSDLGTATVPWNNFHDKSFFAGYTGPVTSRFAPDGYPGPRDDEL